jgi:hypothetical protein
MVQRDPSIHITERQLIKILQDYGSSLSTSKPSLLARYIVEHSKTQSISHRSITVTNERLHRKSEQIKASTRSDAFLFSEVLSLCRKKLHHRGIIAIKPGEKEWLTIKELANLASEFCHEFQLEPKDGFTKYISMALGKIKNYSIHKFKPLHSNICTTYESIKELESDPTPEFTEMMYIEYTRIVNEKIGHTYDDLKKQPDKYFCFYQAKLVAKKMGFGYKDYIKAQFHAFEWANGIPDPFQLYGDKAIERVRKYCFEKNLKINDPQKKINFKNIWAAKKK